MNSAIVKMPTLIPGTLVKRPNRFLGIVTLDDKREVKAFIADPGRLKELLYPGAKVFVAYAAKEGRSTDYDLKAAVLGKSLVSIDSRIPNRIVYRALQDGLLDPFSTYATIKREPTVKAGRLDFLLTGTPKTPCYIEVKSCTLVENGSALFPDAPTIRGARHMRELAELRKEGFRCAVVFIVQNPTATSFSPNKKTDPDFAHAIAAAHGAGVEIYAYLCSVSLQEVRLGSSLPILL